MTLSRWRGPVETMLDLTEGEKDRVAAAVADVAARLTSDHSRRAYAADWRAWCVWCEHSAGIPVLDARPTDVQRHLVELTDYSGAAKRSVQRRLTVIRQVYASFEVHNLISRNPAREVRAPANHRVARRPWLRAEQLAALIRACGGSTWREQRNRLVVMLLATTGLRRAELARLTPADVRRVDSSSLSLSVTTKGGRQLMVAVPAGVDAVLEQWADTVRAERGASASLWSRDGVPFSDGQIGCIVSAAGAQAGLPKGLSTPHALRRTFATLSALSGVDLRELQSALGHSHATTTEHYVRSALPAARAPGEAVLRALEGEQPAKGEQSGTT